MKWLYFWRDDGSFTADEKFKHPKKQKVLEDEQAWDVYIRAKMVLEQARQGVIAGLREPTEEEIEARKIELAKIIESEGLNPDDFF